MSNHEEGNGKPEGEAWLTSTWTIEQTKKEDVEAVLTLYPADPGREAGYIGNLAQALLDAFERIATLETAIQEMLEREIEFRSKYDTIIKQKQALVEAVETILAIASGENQVAQDDTEGMAYIDRQARAALAVQNSGGVSR